MGKKGKRLNFDQFAVPIELIMLFPHIFKVFYFMWVLSILGLVYGKIWPHCQII